MFGVQPKAICVFTEALRKLVFQVPSALAGVEGSVAQRLAADQQHTHTHTMSEAVDSGASLAPGGVKHVCRRSCVVYAL